MSDKPDKQRKFPLKGVNPPKRTTPEAFDEAIRDIREFLKRFPYLAEEVNREREKRLSEYGHSPHN
jgi:hypothetical protein